MHLREQSIQVLALLLEHPGEVVTREELHRRLWPYDVIVDFENNLNAAVSRLRQALGDSAEHPRFIETLPRRGYRFIAKPIQPGRPGVRPRLLVLPFVNASGDPSQEYFSDGVTDELITILSAMAPEDLGVIARTTTMLYKNRRQDIARIGRELSLDWIVEGSVRHQKSRVALTAQLIRVADQTHVFAQWYEVEVDDIFHLERSVAEALGERIGVASAQGRRPASTETTVPGPPTRDLVAYKRYIEGRQHMQEGPAPELWATARKELEGAIERDPRFALAHDALAELWWYMGFFGAISPREALGAGMAHALHAVEIDGSLAEPHAMLAQYLKQLDFNWAAVESEMNLALALNPASPIVRQRRAVTLLMPFCRTREAIADLELALEVDPLDLYTRSWFIALLWFDRQYDSAIEEGRRLLEIAPAQMGPHYSMGLVLREAGRFAEAVAALRRAVELSGGSPQVLGWLGLALAEAGDRASATAVLERLRAMPDSVYVPRTSFAWIHFGLGEVDEFFEWMDRAVDARDHMITPIKVYAFMDRIRHDSRYDRLLEKMNLA